ncbi:MAG: P-loop NTPase [Myxococcaceae bacterium]|nr:P-loop NTPase [Myxococcaceae bacterium]MBH2006135.1 P-loop NTPase [Myxococcaceae bacterium]
MLKDILLKQFSEIRVPEFEKNIVELGWVRRIEIVEKKLQIDLVLPTFALRSKQDCAMAVKKAAMSELPMDTEVELNVFADVQAAVEQSIQKEGLADVKNIVLIVSGKGGVGKSTIAKNMALALAKMGCRVGLLDADVYGPSVPTLFDIPSDTSILGVPGPEGEGNYMLPIEKEGIKLMSIGFLVDTESAMIWRGPMIASASMQMFNNVAWGDLDYLVVDMPPGTGDIHLTVSQRVRTAGAVIVSTPHPLSKADVVRAKAMLDKMNIPAFGLIENMSYYLCEHCSQKHPMFRGEQESDLWSQLHVRNLGQFPLDPNLTHENSIYQDLAHEVATCMAQAAMNKPVPAKKKGHLTVLMN